MKPKPGDLYTISITSETPLIVTTVIKNIGNNGACISSSCKMVKNLKFTAVARSDGGYSFHEIKATLGESR